MITNVETYNNYLSLANHYDQASQWKDSDRNLFAQLGHRLPTEIYAEDFATKVRLFGVTMEYVDTLKQNQIKQILRGIGYTLAFLFCPVVLGFIIIAGSGFGFIPIIVIALYFSLVISFTNVVDCVFEHEMQEAYSNLRFAYKVRSQEDLENCIEKHESTAVWQIRTLSLLNNLIPFIYLYQACTTVSRWKKVLEKQKEHLAVLADQNNRLLAETRDYCGAHFHELCTAYSTKVQHQSDRNRVHTLLHYHRKSYLEELAKKVASTDVLPSVLNNIVIDYL